MPPDPKPARRVVDEAAGVAKVRSEDACRVCGERHWLTRHHLVPRSLGGDDVAANIIPLCQPPRPGEGCHGAFERGRHRARAGHLIRQVLTPEEVAYCLAKKGAAWLERYYPLRHPDG